MSSPGRDRALLELELALRQRPISGTGTGHFHVGGMCVVTDRLGQDGPGVRVIHFSPECSLE